jgi:murein DD-endopeptidase MepM/ murein hydrolase activator NlpD
MTGVNSAREAKAFGATLQNHVEAFPRRHLLLVAGTVLFMGLGLSLLPAGEVNANRKAVQIELPLTLEPMPAARAGPVSGEVWQEIPVKAGDNLSIIFQKVGLSKTDVYHLVHNAEGGKALRRMFPGQSLSFLLDPAGKLAALRHQQSPLQTTLYRRLGDSYSVELITRQPQAHRSFASATIESSLFLAGKDAGLSQNLIMELANIFGGVIDFVLDPRQGDTFHVLYEELYLDGEKYKNGKILAAEFINRGESYTAYRYTDEMGMAGYFSNDGVSMRKAFLLAPVDFTRISSNFNPRRLHPIYKTTRPHRGTDYAAPRGTPVFASGDGRVVQAGYTAANGNYVVIQHGEAYTTKYLHLNKRKVKRGQRVKQQQIVGTIGSTGAATGAHLHYEFLVNGVHRNPRTIHKKLPKAKSLAAAELPRFQSQTSSLQMQLASIRQQQLALGESSSATTLY